MLLRRNYLKSPRSWTFCRAGIPLSLPNLGPLLLRYASNDLGRNEDIGPSCRKVHVVNDQGKLSRRVLLEYVLASIDRRTHFVQLVNKEECIVKVIDGRAAYIREKTHKKNAKKSRKPKEVQMTWTVNENDLMVKLKEVRRHLQKDYLVDVILAPKKNAPVLSLPERQRKVDYIIESLRDCAKEYKERTFERSVLTVYLKSTGEL